MLLFSIILSIHSKNLILVTPQVYLWWESHSQCDDFVYACVCKWDPPHIIIGICCLRLLWSSFVYFTMCCELVQNTNVLSPFAWIVTKLELQGLSYFAFSEDNTNYISIQISIFFYWVLKYVGFAINFILIITWGVWLTFLGYVSNFILINYRSNCPNHKLY